MSTARTALKRNGGEKPAAWRVSREKKTAGRPHPPRESRPAVAGVTRVRDLPRTADPDHGLGGGVTVCIRQFPPYE
ncbi:hypothetical protein Sm713_66690 [Streptomyces sp. TS71-3]|nr:hypothetical protein Sm713_66690 [Streptomyces sp. TS71-3]